MFPPDDEFGHNKKEHQFPPLKTLTARIFLKILQSLFP